MARYKATKEGWDGRRIIQKGEIFNFDGPRGSWMVPVDGAGQPVAGEKIPAEPRQVRAGTKQTTGYTRDQLRVRCRELGIQFPATAGAPALAELIQKHEEAQSAPKPEVAPEGPGGTGNLEVL